MNRHNTTNKMTPASFRKCFPTLAAATMKENRMEQTEATKAEIASLRLRKERGEQLWKEIRGVRDAKRQLQEEILEARADVRTLEKKMEGLEEREELIAAHLCLDGGPGQGEQPANDAWMEVPTIVLIPNKQIAAKLVEAGLDNFGRLEAWRAKVNGPGGEPHRIKGFGPAKMQAVEDAVVKYWTENSRPVSPAVDAAD